MASLIAGESSAWLPSFVNRGAASSIRAPENQHGVAVSPSGTGSEKDWVHVVSLCCKLDIPIFNPPFMAIATRSARSNERSSIVRHVPLDLRGYNVVQKKCQVSHSPLGALQLDIATALRELQILGHPAFSKHENIIHLVGVTWDEELPEYNLGLNPALLLDFADLGTLSDVLQQEQSLSFQEKMAVCYDVGKGLSSLHEYGVIHGDIKAENVLVRSGGDRKWVVKLADFDLSLTDLKKNQRLPGGTTPWRAPESWDSVDLCLCCLKSTDVYSFGMLIWRVLCDGKNPFAFWLGITSLEEMEKTKRDDCFVDTALAALNTLLDGTPDSGKANVRNAMRNALQFLPGNRTLATTMSYLNATTCSLDEPDFKNQHEKCPTRSGSVDLEDIYIEQELMKYADPVFNENLVSCLQRIALDDLNPHRRAQARLHLSMAALNGFGNCSDASTGLRYAIESAQGGCVESQAVIYRIHESMNADVSSNLPIIDWLINGVHTGSIIAAQDLHNISPSDYYDAIQHFKTINCGIGRPLFDQALFSLSDVASVVEGVLNDVGDTLLHLAAVRGDPGWLLNILSNQGVQELINVSNFYHETPLLYACRCGHAEIIRILLANGANGALASRSREGPLHWISSFDEIHIPEMARLLKDSGAALKMSAEKPINYYRHQCNGLGPGTPLLRAVARGSLVAVTALLDIGASPIGRVSATPQPLVRGQYYAGGDLVNSKDLRSHQLEKLRKECPMAAACSQHRWEIVDVLLQKLQDLDIDMLNCKREAPKSYSLWSKLSDRVVVKALDWYHQDYGDSDAFERLNAVFPHFTALYFACLSEMPFSRQMMHGSRRADMMTRTIGLLVNKGASLSCVSKFKSTALYAAVEGRNTDIVSLLLSEYGTCRRHINLSYQGCRGQRPLEHAIAFDQKDMFDLLVESDALIDGALQTCGIANHKNLYYAQSLISFGAGEDENLKIGLGDPLTLAVLREKMDLATMLVHKWPQKLGEIPKKAMLTATPLAFIVIMTILRSRPNYRPIRFLLQMHRQYGVRIGKPTSDNEFDDIISTAIAANWGQRNTEAMDEDREDSAVMQQVLRDLLMSIDMIDNVDIAKSVHVASQTRNVAALEVLLEFGADMNYITDLMGSKKTGWSTLEWAQSALKHKVPPKVSALGKLASDRYQKTSARIVEILIQGGAMTSFDLRGHEIYGERVATAIGNVITFKVYVDLLDDIWGAKTTYSDKLRRWTLRNARYL